MKELTTTIFALALISANCLGLDTAKIDEITGIKGTLNEAEGVYKISLPRDDVKVRVDGWQMPPFMGLTSWASFTKGEKAPAMVMGDLVLFQDEINPVMSAAFDAGLSVTALHNHFFYDDPKVYFMHIAGEGEVQKLAASIKAAFAKVKEIRAALPQPTTTFGKALPGKNSISGAGIDELLQSKGQAKDGMFKVVIGRKAKMPCGCEVGKEMGVNTWAAFAGDDDNAIVDGDFVVTEDELQPVLRSLRGSNINVVAIHNHMTHEQPRMIFLHYWGRGRAVELARALKDAIDLTNSDQKT